MSMHGTALWLLLAGAPFVPADDPFPVPMPVIVTGTVEAPVVAAGAPAEAPTLKKTAPSIRLEVPPDKRFARDTAVMIRVVKSGGPVRELVRSIEPPVELLPLKDDDTICFVAAPGFYTVRLLAIGAEIGYDQQEVRIQIKDPAPPAAVQAQAAPQTASDLLRSWVVQVNSRTRDSEAVEIAKAARVVADGIRSRRIDASRAVEEWTAEAYLRMGAAFAPWNTSTAGPSFFGHMRDEFEKNKSVKDPNPANLLENLADILEKL